MNKKYIVGAALSRPYPCIDYLCETSLSLGLNPPEEHSFCLILTGMVRLFVLLYNTFQQDVHLWNDHRFM